MDREISADELTKELILQLAQSGCHPIVEMARYALGDVVGLGLMTQEELDQDAIYDYDGELIQKSGKERSLELLPVKVRFDANKELAQYVWSKAKDSDERNTEDAMERVVYNMPDNGRYIPPPETDSDAIEAEIVTDD